MTPSPVRRAAEHEQVMAAKESEIQMRPDEKVTILVWRWENAPKKFRALSVHGGDEDWLAFVPMALREDYIGWMESGTAFGVCDVSKHPVEGGTVYIGAHA